MRFRGLLHAELIGELASLGHTDIIVIADAGLPIPLGPKKIDLAVCPGLPTFMQICSVIGAELPIDDVIIASEMNTHNLSLHTTFHQEIEKWRMVQQKAIATQEVSHENFKELSKQARVIVRTGEFSPFANVIIRAGVSF